MKKILVVENDWCDRKLTMTVLSSKLDVELKACDKLLDALSLAKKEHFDLIIAEWYPLEYDGITFTRLLRRINVNTPVIIVSYESKSTYIETDEEEIKKIDIFAIVNKPYDPHEFRDLVLKILGEKQ